MFVTTGVDVTTAESVEVTTAVLVPVVVVTSTKQSSKQSCMVFDKMYITLA